MGTRADFYVGREKDAEWLGSIAWDGYPQGLERHPFLLTATTEAIFRQAVSIALDTRNDATKPEHGGPWPWKDSNTTDYAYAFDDGHVWGSCFGRPWFDASEPEPESDDYEGIMPDFPDMTDKKSVTYGQLSGLIVVTERGLVTEN